jgi:hypothetical protein
MSMLFQKPHGPDDDKKCDGDLYTGPGGIDTQVQLVISLSLGLSAFLAFCVSLPDPPLSAPSPDRSP